MPNIMQSDHPNVLENFGELEKMARGRVVTLFLDYDGTLTPIVSNPDDAYLSDETRKAIQSLAMLFPTAIISGRGRAKVEEFVQLAELYYAGSHGMDIAAPKFSDVSLAFQPAAQYESLIQDITKKLEEVTRHIQGSSIEDNKYCVSVHFRNCHQDSYQEILALVESIVAEEPDLHITRGRKVLEIRPSVNWDKGSALLHLLSMLGIPESEVFCLYIGDDRTDEDAFRVLVDHGIGAGILVSNKVKPTKGIWTVRDPYEVTKLLKKLIEFGNSNQNLWHTKLGCKGWKIQPTV
jgi:trehalose 6-phosphate phosphatase